MNARLRDLLDKRAKAWSAVQDIQARRSAAGYESTEEDGETYTRALDDVDTLSKEIETEERAIRMEAALRAPVDDQRNTNPRSGAGEGNDSAAQYEAAFRSFLRRGIGEVSPDEQKLLRDGYAEIRAAGTTSGGAGGYTVPTQFLARMIESLKAFGGIAGVAETITTDNGDTIQWPTNDDTSNVGALLSENTQVTEQDFTFGTGSLSAYMFSSKLVRVSFQLLQDSAFNLDAWLPNKLGERIGRAAAGYFATGTGTSQPQGITVGLTAGITSAAVALAYDDFVDIEHSIDPAYRSDRSRYVVHDSVIKALRKLKDTTGRPLWAPAITAGAPSTINGHPYTVDNNLATLAAGSKSIVFGDIERAYVVRAVTGAQALRLTERYADYLQVGFLGFQRLDAKVQDTGAAAVLTTHA